MKTPLQQARQGDVKAIEALLQQAVASHIQVRLAQNGKRLEVNLETEDKPISNSLIHIIRKGLQELRFTPFEQVVVFARQSDKKTQQWAYGFNLKLTIVDSPKPQKQKVQLPKLQLNSSQKKYLLIGVLTSVALILIGSLGNLGYQLYSQNQKLNQANAIVQQATQAPEDLSKLKSNVQELFKAVRLLQQVPNIPGSRYKEAREKLLVLQQTISQMNQRIEQEESANQSFEQLRQQIEKVKENIKQPPHALKTWQSAQESFQETIKQLKAIPQSSFLYSSAQEELKSYENSLAFIETQLAVEEKAASSFRQAEITAKQAKSVLGYSPSISELRASKDLWQNAIKILAEVPKNSSLYDQVNEYNNAYKTNINLINGAITEQQNCLKKNPNLEFLCDDSVSLESTPEHFNKDEETNY